MLLGNGYSIIGGVAQLLGRQSLTGGLTLIYG